MMPIRKPPSKVPLIRHPHPPIIILQSTIQIPMIPLTKISVSVNVSWNLYVMVDSGFTFYVFESVGLLDDFSAFEVVWEGGEDVVSVVPDLGADLDVLADVPAVGVAGDAAAVG